MRGHRPFLEFRLRAGDVATDGRRCRPPKLWASIPGKTAQPTPRHIQIRGAAYKDLRSKVVP
jgi:hypothetical protein